MTTNSNNKINRTLQIRDGYEELLKEIDDYFKGKQGWSIDHSILSLKEIRAKIEMLEKDIDSKQKTNRNC
ncbi:hypothetical protein [Sporosarcina highlanderae]|uniref:Uncharacterized protein n=1 Tax=Sporosarcina highlanderae TaxID=3035916 RepID=A0ABT8JPU6_9BACL|nr:hypothetical protein [Sporosarcina highlanderae]MDN4607173.1 hypothetical protein [Sporosarcina highlanderae]